MRIKTLLSNLIIHSQKILTDSENSLISETFNAALNHFVDSSQNLLVSKNPISRIIYIIISFQ